MVIAPTGNKKHFFLKLNPPRPTFSLDKTETEREIMLQHVAYWAPYVANGTMLVMGPVLGEKGGFGVGVIEVEDEAQLHKLIAGDPVNSLCTYEIHPMIVRTRL